MDAATMTLAISPDMGSVVTYELELKLWGSCPTHMQYKICNGLKKSTTPNCDTQTIAMLSSRFPDDFVISLNQKVN